MLSTENVTKKGDVCRVSLKCHEGTIHSRNVVSPKVFRHGCLEVPRNEVLTPPSSALRRTVPHSNPSLVHTLAHACSPASLQLNVDRVQ